MSIPEKKEASARAIIFREEERITQMIFKLMSQDKIKMGRKKCLRVLISYQYIFISMQYVLRVPYSLYIEMIF